MLKKSIAALLACSILVFCFGCTETDNKTLSSEDVSSSSGSTEDTAELTYFYNELINDDTVVVPVSAPDQCLYNYELLKSGEKDLTWAYNEIVYAATHLSNPNAEFKNVTEVFFAESLTDAELATVYRSVCYDHPELWFLRQPDKNGCALHPANDKMAYLTYSEDIKDIPGLTDKINDVAKKIVKEANKFSHNIDKIAYISSYIYDNYRISWPTYDTTQHSTIKEMFLDGYGVCVGFASTLTYLFQQTGIPSIMGHGIVSTGVAHFWAIVEHDGIYKYVDNYYMEEKGGGTEHNMSEFFCFDTIDPYKYMYVTIDKDVLLPGTEIGANITASTLPEDPVSSESEPIQS